MTSKDKNGAVPADKKLEVNTTRLEALAAEVGQVAQSKRWKAHKNGISDEVEPSAVRSLNHDEEARAQAEAAMQAMMAKPGSKRRGW